jgi:ComF family protein
MKRTGQEPLATALGRLLADQVAEVFAESPPQLVLPVPQHWWSRTTRGHNPTETLGRVVARRLTAEFHPHLVVKTRRTPAQSRLSPTGRRDNLRDAFVVRGRERIAGRRVLLVDDVLTTGTTANRIARLLRSAGAQTIMVAVVARGLGDARDLDPF